MTESLLICLAGGALGVLLSLGATAWLIRHWTELPRGSDTHPDGMAVGFALGITFDFTTSPIRYLNPGASVLLVKNRTAFQTRYGHAYDWTIPAHPGVGTWSIVAHGGDPQYLQSVSISTAMRQALVVPAHTEGGGDDD